MSQPPPWPNQQQPPAPPPYPPQQPPAWQPPPVQPVQAAIPWYYQKWFVVLMIIIFFPAGLILLWKSPATRTSGRIVWSAIIALGFLMYNTDSSSTSPAPQSKPAASTPAPAKAADPKPATPTPPPAQPKEPAQPVYNFTLTGDGVKYKGKLASNVGVAVVKVEVKASVGSDYVTQKADGKFIVVQVGVANFQKDAITVDSNSFKIVAGGKEYSGSVEGSTALEMSDRETFFLKKLNPDVNTSGWLIFDVPKALDLDTAQLRFQGGFTGKAETLPLKPITE